MSIVLTCDKCGEPITEDEDYISAQLTTVEATQNPNEAPAQSTPVRVDWHTEHAPPDVVTPVKRG